MSAVDSATTGLNRHLRRLAKASPLLADLSRADVLVMIPVDGGFEVVSHVRPINARTIYPIDQVGTALSVEERPLLTRAFRTGEILDGGVYLKSQSRWIRTLAVPVRFNGEIVAVLAREFSPQVEVMPGDLELICFATFRRLGAMIASGVYPFGAETRSHDHPPRVGDGVMLFDTSGRLDYASPNALTVLRQVDATSVNLGQRFGDMGIDAPGMVEAYANGLDYTDEIEIGTAVLSTWCLPLLVQGTITGALVLVRNITELRQRDRLLLTKDATITEIHHRVKNSLQTVSSLLQLQTRRVASPDARVALEESVRRIRSIGVVHELLSQRTDDEVNFGEILRTLTTMVSDSLVAPHRSVRFDIDVEHIILPSHLTTPMALIVSELMQNAIDHSQCEVVTVSLIRESSAIGLTVADDGLGFARLPPTTETRRLGLTIVETIVDSELGGSIRYRDNEPGATIQIDIPLYTDRAPT